jgi:early secretory antigenic target protein ESAT-6
MAVTGIRVTPEQLQQVSAQLDAGASSIEGTLRQLAGNVAPLGSDWAGVAQARFLELWAEWQRSGTTLHQALTGIARLTARAGASYESAEHGIAATFGRTCPGSARPIGAPDRLVTLKRLEGCAREIVN